MTLSRVGCAVGARVEALAELAEGADVGFEVSYAFM
jgi:hypothetical protein